MNDFDYLYKDFENYIINLISEDEFKFIKSKGIKYVNELFELYIKDKNKIENKIYCDMKNI